MKIVHIVDDEYALVGALDIMLRHAGYRTLTSGNGREALAAMAKVTPALVLLDVMMPVADGYEVLAEVRRNPRLERIPVVMMSGTSPDARRRPLHWAAWLDKPFQFAQLLDAVVQLIGPAEVARDER